MKFSLNTREWPFLLVKLLVSGRLSSQMRASNVAVMHVGRHISSLVLGYDKYVQFCLENAEGNEYMRFCEINLYPRRPRYFVCSRFAEKNKSILSGILRGIMDATLGRTVKAKRNGADVQLIDGIADGV